jgi:hypothetical protein
MNKTTKILALLVASIIGMFVVNILEHGFPHGVGLTFALLVIFAAIAFLLDTWID